MVTPSAGGPQEMTCIPLRRLFGWLMTIHPTKVKPEQREKLIRYQQECDRVLAAHFTGVAAKREEALTGAIERADRSQRQLAGVVCAFKPKWAQIAMLQASGTYRGRVWRILGWPEQKTMAVIEEMERLRVIDRDDWRPSMFGIDDAPGDQGVLEELARVGHGRGRED